MGPQVTMDEKMCAQSTILKLLEAEQYKKKKSERGMLWKLFSTIEKSIHTLIDIAKKKTK